MYMAYFNPLSFSAGTDFRRQNLTSVDVTFWRLKSIPAEKQWNIYKGATIRFPGGGEQEYLSRANYLFRWKFHILLHVYMEQFL